MTGQVCPYLGTVDDEGAYIPTPDVANRCYAVATRRAARIEPGFQESVCLAGHPSRCSRYVAAERQPARQPSPRWFAIGGGLAGVVVLACCALSALVLVLGGASAARMGLLARVTDTPPPTATDTVTVTVTATATVTDTATATATLTPTWTATATLAPTGQVASTATFMPQPPTSIPTLTRVTVAGDTFVSPLATPAPRLAATQPRPPATSQPMTTATRGLTSTPSATSTRTATATPQMTCRAGDTMTFIPASPLTGKSFTIEVRSLVPYVDVGLTGGAGKPHFNGVDQSGSYYVWRWEDRVATAGIYSYNFQIRRGAATCLTRSVTVVAPTNTPSPTPTFAPEYKVELTLIGGDDFKPIFTDTEPVIFELELVNGGNLTDTFRIGFDAERPEGWTAEYCIGESCSTDSGTELTLLEGGSQKLFIRLIAPSDAQEKDELTATLSVESLGDPNQKQSVSVTVMVRRSASTPDATSTPTATAEATPDASSTPTATATPDASSTPTATATPDQ